VADFNGDGVADLAVGGGNIWIGNGDGTFRPPVSTAVTAETSMVGDFNGDGKADLLLTGTGNCNSINKPTCYDDVAEVYLGNGDGTFQSPTVVFQGQGASMPSLVPRLIFAAEDFDGDGTLDLVFVDRNSFTFLPGKGDGTFGPPRAFGVSVAGGVVTSLARGDFNGDGIVDLAAITVSTDPNVIITVSTVNLLIGNGDGTFQPSVNQAVPGIASPLAVADFNGDGKADLVIANSAGGSMSVLLGAPTGERLHPVRAPRLK
jgi:hypothetical protein